MPGFESYSYDQVLIDLLKVASQTYSRQEVAEEMAKYWHQPATAESLLSQLDADEYELKQVNISDIPGVDFGAADESLAEEYAQRTTPFPPIVLNNNSEEGFIADGRHRLAAALQRGDSTIAAFMPSNWPPLTAVKGDPADQFLGEARTIKGAELELKKSNSSTVEIFLIKVPRNQRDQGQGSATLKQLTALADRLNVTLVLDASPADNYGLGYGELHDWYERNGFVFGADPEAHDVADWGIRKPRVSKEVRWGQPPPK